MAVTSFWTGSVLSTLRPPLRRRQLRQQRKWIQTLCQFFTTKIDPKTGTLLKRISEQVPLVRAPNIILAMKSLAIEWEMGSNKPLKMTSWHSQESPVHWPTRSDVERNNFNVGSWTSSMFGTEMLQRHQRTKRMSDRQLSLRLAGQSWQGDSWF